MEGRRGWGAVLAQDEGVGGDEHEEDCNLKADRANWAPTKVKRHVKNMTA